MVTLTGQEDGSKSALVKRQTQETGAEVLLVLVIFSQPAVASCFEFVFKIQRIKNAVLIY